MGAFAARLLLLKQEAGDPSYAEMASRLGAAASKSSLASAARGQRLPTWETTWEFVRVLAVDRLGRDAGETEREWRELWERARTEPGDGPVDGPVDGPGDGPVDGPAAVEGVPRAARRGQVLAYVMASVAVVTASVTVLYLALREDRRVTPPSPAPTASVIPRDDSEFLGDVTFPDGSKVRTNATFTKTWRVRNTGTIPWEGRLLARVNADPCKSPETVVIPPTAPGQTVDLSVRVRAPGKPGKCRIYYKMTDAQGRVLFPLKRPVFLDIRVVDP
ncbi:NBR1-Ig-like domain-containing protein [Nonomuraea indica]|uniref:NBR1-Ig-like domain-containing protein n=1 Tax=Nonomuraea indica TaxID=1581193 RepID=UPI000C7DA0B1|nr:NBR1-Ig-like domain-containing protein [Nonomuraea indica]